MLHHKTYTKGRIWLTPKEIARADNGWTVVARPQEDGKYMVAAVNLQTGLPYDSRVIYVDSRDEIATAAKEQLRWLSKMGYDVDMADATRVRLAAKKKKETFEEYVEGKTFPSPKTGKKIKFESLPSDHQKRIREHWQEASERGADEDKDFGVTELLSDYSLSIVGKDKKRAAYVAKKVKEGIDKNADMCKVDPPTCEGNLGIGRDNMPQIMNKSVKQLLDSPKEDERKKGQAAVDAGADPKSDKSIQDIMLDDLQKEGVKVKKNVKIPVGKLKATQREIKASKSFGMADAYYKGDFDPAKGEVILVSSDNHILDGHHRWAALLLADPDRKMTVIQIDMPMRELLRRTMKQPGVYRADLQDRVIPKDTPLDLNEPKKKEASLRNAVLKLAHEVPELRKHLVPLLRTSGRYNPSEDSSPMTDMAAYTENLYNHFLLPYPAIWNSLGVEKNEVRGSWKMQGDNGIIKFVSPIAKASILINIFPDGEHVVMGKARGATITPKKFKYRPAFPGMHRGTQGWISSYIEEVLPAKITYWVSGREFDSKEDMLRVYKQVGVETSGRKELQGQPLLKGLVGPMFDGRKGDTVVVRYETQEMYDMLTR